MKKTNWIEVAIGLLLIAISVINIVPGDEVVAVPLGLLLIADGFKVKK